MVQLIYLWPAPAIALDHSGTCTGTFAAGDNPHNLTGTCTVPAGQTLTIEAGVELEGNNRSRQVGGTLQADGITYTEANMRFQPSDGRNLTNSMVPGSSSVLVDGSGSLTTLSPRSFDNTSNVIKPRASFQA